MYRCRHEQGEDPYASGNENRRQNRNRLNRDIDTRNFFRRFNRGFYGSPGLSAFGMGPRELAFNTFRRSPDYSGRPGMWGSTFDDDFESDNDESPSFWYSKRPPPYYGDTLRSGRRRRSSGRSYGDYYGADSDDYIYRYPPAHSSLGRGRRY